MTPAYAILSVLSGAVFGLLAWMESGLFWGAVTYAASGSIVLLGLAFLIATAKPRGRGAVRPGAA